MVKATSKAKREHKVLSRWENKNLGSFEKWYVALRSRLVRVIRINRGAAPVVQWDRRHLWSAGMQVWSLAWHSCLGIQGCSSCGTGHKCGSHLIPGLGTHMPWDDQNKQKKKRNQTNIHVIKQNEAEICGSAVLLLQYQNGLSCCDKVPATDWESSKCVTRRDDTEAYLCWWQNDARKST